MNQVQNFNGKDYYLYPGERYFTKGSKYLHRVIWEFHNGPIPEGRQIHHKNSDPVDNRIENLNLISSSLHQRFETARRVEADPVAFQERMSHARKFVPKMDPESRAKNAKKGWNGVRRYLKNCSVCGKIYQTPFPERSKYCHQNCKAKALRARIKK